MSKVRALISGFVGLNGVPIPVHEGDEWDADDALVQARPDLFSEPVEPEKPARRAVAREPRGGNG